MSDDEAWVRETEAKITSAAGVFAVDRSVFYRENLSRLMRRALTLGVRREQVIARSALPREEAERLLGEEASLLAR